MTKGRRHELKLSLLYWFAAPNFALSIMHMPVLMILPAYYAKSTQTSLAAIGTILLFDRLFDAVTDPLVGFWSDRTYSRIGSRKPWIMAGIPLACVATIYLFTPAATAGATYFLIWSILLFSAWTLIDIPYIAWGAELSRDYNERSRIMTIRGTVGFVGSFLFMASPILLAPWTGSTEIGAEALEISAWLIAITLPLFMGMALILVPPGTKVAIRKTSAKSLVAALRINKPLRFYSVVQFAGGVAAGSWGATVLLFCDSINLGDKFPFLLLAAWGTRICVAPLWLKLIYRFGKHHVWALGSALSAVITPLALLAEPGENTIYLILVYAVILGFVETAWMVTPRAIYGDIIDYDALKTGADQAGTYFALSGLIDKAATAVGGGLAFYILSLMDYDVAGANNDQQLWALYLSFGILPAIIYLGVGIAMRKFPLDARRHSIIRRRIESRARRQQETMD